MVRSINHAQGRQTAPLLSGLSRRGGRALPFVLRLILGCSLILGPISGPFSSPISSWFAPSELHAATAAQELPSQVAPAQAPPGQAESFPEARQAPAPSEPADAAAKQAAPVKSQESGKTADDAYSLKSYFWGVGVLFLLLACLWIAASLLKRRGGFKIFGQGPVLRLESRMALNRNAQLFIVNFEDRRLLLGVTEQRINLLSESAGELADEEQAAPAVADKSKANKAKTGKSETDADFKAELEKADGSGLQIS